MKSNILKEKSFGFAVRIVKLSQMLIKEKKEFVIGKQIIRSGSSIGAMVREAEYAESKADFVHKMNIALKTLNFNDKNNKIKHKQQNKIEIINC